MTTNDTLSMQEAMETQRAIRRVQFDPLDHQQIMQLIELGTRAPSSMNKQAWEFVVVTDPTIKRKFGQLNRRLWNLSRYFVQRQAKGDPHAEKVAQAPQWAVDHFEQYPALIVACYRGRWQHWLPILASNYYASILPAVQNILLAARSMGLGANLTNMPLLSPWYARRLLGLPANIQPVMLITLGKPLGRYGPNRRKPVGDVVSFNRYQNRPYEGLTSQQIEELSHV